MRTRLTTLCVALLLGLRAFGQGGDFVLTNPDGSLYRPTNFLTANAAAISSALNISLLVPNSRLLSTSGSLTGGGDLSANRTISLVGDNASPGASVYYGTDGSGTKGFYPLPSGGSTNSIGEAPNNGTAYLRRNAAWSAADFTLITGTASDGQIPAAIARDSEVTSLLSGYQLLDPDLTDLADGSLTGSKVGPGIDGANVTTGTTGSGLLVRQSAAGGSSIGTNGAAVGYPAVFQPDGTFAATNSATVSNMTVTGTFDIGTNIVPLARGGTAGTNAAQALANIGAQAADADLDDLADGSLSGSKVGPGIDGANVTTGTTGSGLLVRQSAAGGSFAWDVDVTFSITNAAGEFYPVYTNSVADGVARSFFLRMQESGATNTADFNFGGRVVNRGGTASGTNWVEHYYVNDSNSWCYVTNVGTNAVVYVRGPVNGPQNGRVWGTISTVTNGGTLAGGGPPPMTNAVVAHWEFSETGNASLGDSIGGNNLTISSGDTAPTTNSLTSAGSARALNDGDNVYFSTTDNAALSMNTNASFTFTGWMRANTVAANRYVAAKGGEWSLQMLAADSTLRFTVANATTNRILIGPVLSSGVTYFVGAGYDFTNATAYMLVMSASATNYYSTNYAAGLQDSSAEFFVSGHPSVTTQNWDGTLDEFTLFKRAVGTNDLKTLYNSGSGRQWPWSGL